jgi:hypothetical protein
MINRFLDHHVPRKYLFIAAGHLQVAMSIVCHEEKTMAGIFSPVE